MSEWKEYKLGEICEVTSSKRIFYSEYVSSGVPFYRSKEIIDLYNKRDISTELFISDEKYYNIKNKFGVPKPDDILLTSVGSLGIPYKVKLNDKFYFKDGNITWFRNFDKKLVNPDYLIYWLCSRIGIQKLDEITIGSTQAALTISGLKTISFTLPPLEEQRTIAGVLGTLDDKIGLLNRQNQTLESMAEALFRHYFIDNTQSDWKDGVISDLIDFNPTRKLTKNTVAPFLEMSELSTRTYAPNGWYERVFTSGTKFQNGDTLLARITPCLENGKTAYVDFLKENQVGWGSTEYIVMRPKEILHPFFAYVIAKLQDFRDFAESCMSGSSGRQRVDVENLKSYEIQIPDSENIKHFNIFAESVVSKMNFNNKQIRTLTQLRNKLLLYLMINKI